MVVRLTPYVMASAHAKPTATRQSSPTTKSYQNAANARSQAMTAAIIGGPPR